MEVDNLHKEYCFIKNSSEIAILFVHGIVESPNQFHDFIEALKHQYSVVNVLLPGHGKTGKDFARSSMKQWLDYVEAKVRELEKNHKTILIVGHSMGALLALEAAKNHPDTIKGLFLLAVPFYIKLSYRGAVNGLKIVFHRIHPSDTIAVAAKRDYSIGETSFLCYFTWIPRYVELYWKARQVRLLVGDISFPFIVVQSKQDEFVQRKSKELVQKQKNITLYEVDKSGHFYYIEEERRNILTLFLQYVEKVVGN